jgi:hypothetical protein
VQAARKLPPPRHRSSTLSCVRWWSELESLAQIWPKPVCCGKGRKSWFPVVVTAHRHPTVIKPSTAFATLSGSAAPKPRYGGAGWSIAPGFLN